MQIVKQIYVTLFQSVINFHYFNNKFGRFKITVHIYNKSNESTKALQSASELIFFWFFLLTVLKCFKHEQKSKNWNEQDGRSYKDCGSRRHIG